MLNHLRYCAVWALCLGWGHFALADPGGVWKVAGGEMTFSLMPQQLKSQDLNLTLIDQTVGAEGDTTSATIAISPDSRLSVRVDGGIVVGMIGELEFDMGLGLVGPLGSKRLPRLLLVMGTSMDTEWFLSAEGPESSQEAFVFRNIDMLFDRVSGTLQATTDDLSLSRAWAKSLGAEHLIGVSLGGMVLRLSMAPVGDTSDPYASPSALGSTAGVVEVGPDVIVARLQSTRNYPTESGMSAFAIGTTSCNIGDVPAQWVASTNEHPVISQNMYRMADGRFEQIGMSWLKHGFAALSEDECQLGCDVHQDTSKLYVGCSDPYTASLNGLQSGLGPRSRVNPHTGYFPFGFTEPSSWPPYDESSFLPRRLQVANNDLDPVLHPDAVFYAESQYVMADDAAYGNNNNNSSYRKITVVGPFDEDEYSATFRFGDTTQREQAAIRAWQDNDITVVETEVQVPGEGLFILSSKAWDMGNGFWQYEYALQNVNSDRACGALRIPIPVGVPIGETGFHDVPYHSGETYDGTDWAVTIASDEISWRTATFDVNPDANALRWGTLYNFRFQSAAAPGNVFATLDLFKPGPLASVSARMLGPGGAVIDCNNNAISDACDLNCSTPGCVEPCGLSVDCNTNNIPDECEPDCNENGVADGCDISSGSSNDCNLNTVPDDCEPDCDSDGIPDECDTFDDCDLDGIEDCLDLCTCSTPEGACVCPAVGLCCFPLSGQCIEDYPRDSCISLGGVPDCLEAPCKDGCLLGDPDEDLDRDMQDVGVLLSCFTGALEDLGFEPPSSKCLLHFDIDDDGDVDLTDYDLFSDEYSGP